MTPIPLFALLVACAWEVPTDPEADTLLNVIEGTVVVTGADVPAETYVVLYDAFDPPPPDGTGDAVNFASIPADAYDADGVGVFAAPYALTGVPDGTWIVSALLDADHDFQPMLSSHKGVTCGDWYGAHLADLSTGELGFVTVEGGQLKQDVTVVVGSQMPYERPAFEYVSEHIDQASQDGSGLLFTLANLGIDTDPLVLTGPADLPDDADYSEVDFCDTMFLVMAVDADGDGLPDPHPDLGEYNESAYDIWPRVYFQYLGPDQSDEGAGGGVVLQQGESYVGQAFIYPDFLNGWVAAGMLNTPVPMTELTAVFLPAAQHQLPDGSTEVVQSPDLPRGMWGVTVISLTGQTWTVPNELVVLPSTSADYNPASQGRYLLVE